jgi:Zn-dependent protease with chaperone function/type II secretory pathway pseudopilin PulG
MKEDRLVHPRERTLGKLTLTLGLLLWLGLVVGTFGIALMVLLVGYVIYLFSHSALIAHLKGNGVEITPTQFPDLHEHLQACCERLEMANRPSAYVLTGNGALNAFATRFLGNEYVVLLSDTVDAMQRHPDGLRFYIGHELGHLRRKHLSGSLLRWPVLWWPLLGAAYSRARESTCDRHGAACCDSAESAVRALTALAAGPHRWEQLDLASYRRQASHSAGFWMSFHELIGGYPWLTKRAVRVMDAEAALPRRHALAYLPAAVVPFAGRLGGGFGLLIMVYVVGVLAAVALPAYHDHQAKQLLAQAVAASQTVREQLSAYYAEHQSAPESLQAAGLPDSLTDGSLLSLDNESMVLTVSSDAGSLNFSPPLDDKGTLQWHCSAGDDLRPQRLPANCQ